MGNTSAPQEVRLDRPAVPRGGNGSEDNEIMSRTGERLRWCVGVALGTMFLAAGTVQASVPPSVAALQKQGFRVAVRPDGARVRFLGGPPGSALPVDAPLAKQATAQARATAALQQYAPLFGIRNPSTDLEPAWTRTLADGRAVAGYRQVVGGVPVLGGELRVQVAPDGAVTAINGEATPGSVDVAPSVSSARAVETALSAVAKWYAAEPSTLEAGKPELVVYDPQLLQPGQGPVRLAWKVEVTAAQAPVQELVLVDARDGSIALHFNQVDAARNRMTYSADGTPVQRRTLLCTEAQADCTGGVDPEGDDAHRFAGATYDFFFSRFGRDGIDGAGSPLISTVHWNDGVSCPNAFWDGDEMTYCDGAVADDIAAHEMVHGITQAEANLFYYYQAGAINESMSDIFGEFVDLTDGAGDDSEAVRWLLGEDAPAFGGAVRDMSNPASTERLGPFGTAQPDRMSSPLYHRAGTDQGGVHINSGIGNKAAYLMTDGDTFNGITVRGLGLDKVAAIHYEALTNLLTSGSDYLDLYYALQQACLNLVGTRGITEADCAEVRAAAEAVEMDEEPAPGFNPEAELCPAGEVPHDYFFDDMENPASGNWVFRALGGPSVWGYVAGYATSGQSALWAPAPAQTTDAVAEMAPAVGVPHQAHLHFRHAFEFEQGAAGTRTYDGGFLEYSTDGGKTWFDAGHLIAAGQGYNGALDPDQGNPNPGHAAFVRVSHGYVSTRLDLEPLAGQHARFRWRISTDPSAGTLGWFLDDVRLYVCKIELVADAGPDGIVTEGEQVTLDGSRSQGDQATYTWVQTLGPTVQLSDPSSKTPTFTVPSQDGVLVFQLTAVDRFGESKTDTVTLDINLKPRADAGPDQTVRAKSTVQLDGTGSADPEGDPITYRWEQVSGKAVTLSAPDTARPTFQAPNQNGTLVFRLTVADDNGAIATDTVSVRVEGASGGGAVGPWSLLALGAAGWILRRRRSI